MKIADLERAPGSRRITVPFKRVRGQSLDQVAMQNPGLLVWAIEKQLDWAMANYNAIQDALMAANIRRAQNAEPPNLTPHQLEQANGVLSAFEDREPIARLQGGAGYGKSYTIAHIAREMMLRGHYVAATAVSYVAAQVLSRQLGFLDIQGATLARILKFEKLFDETTGADVYEHSVETAPLAELLLGENRLLVVDECSMISDRDADLLIATAKRSDGHLLLVGDRFQLPPVKQEELSRCCTVECPTFELLEPMRYSRDSALYGMEAQMRSAPSSWRDAPYDEVDLCHEPPAGAAATFVDTYQRHPDASHRMLFFRRTQVTAANRILRAALFPDAKEDIEPGEKLMVLATEDIRPANAIDDTAEPRRFYSGEIFDVTDVWEDFYEIYIQEQLFEIPHLSILLRGVEKPVRVMFGVTENRIDETKTGAREYQHALRCARALGLSDEGDWRPYKKLMMNFLRVSYTYATTVHRAQGQTMDYVYTDPQQLLAVGGHMGEALAYVACTRARRRLMTL